MSDKATPRSLFKNFPHLRDAKNIPSITDKLDSKYNQYKNLQKPEPSKPLYYKGRKIPKFEIWVRRNPKRFKIYTVTGGLLIFFSKPIYDIILKPVWSLF